MSESHESAYNKVCGWLGVLTVIEVVAALPSLRFLSWNTLMGVLIGLAIVKAAMVAMYFMHLRFERRTLVAICLTPIFLSIVIMSFVMPDSGRKTTPAGAPDAVHHGK